MLLSKLNMTTEILNTMIIVFKNKNYRVKFREYKSVIETDIKSLELKSPNEVWRWARLHKAKVYYDLT